jgi:hypothetical protein
MQIEYFHSLNVDWDQTFLNIVFENPQPWKFPGCGVALGMFSTVANCGV